MGFIWTCNLGECQSLKVTNGYYVSRVWVSGVTLSGSRLSPIMRSVTPIHDHQRDYQYFITVRISPPQNSLQRYYASFASSYPIPLRFILTSSSHWRYRSQAALIQWYSDRKFYNHLLSPPSIQNVAPFSFKIRWLIHHVGEVWFMLLCLLRCCFNIPEKKCKFSLSNLPNICYIYSHDIFKLALLTFRLPD